MRDSHTPRIWAGSGCRRWRCPLVLRTDHTPGWRNGFGGSQRMEPYRLEATAAANWAALGWDCLPGHWLSCDNCLLRNSPSCNERQDEQGNIPVILPRPLSCPMWTTGLDTFS